MRLLCLLLLVVPLTLRAQFTYTLDQSIPVHDLNGTQLRIPWAGGLNAAQFNTMDLNGDGIDDLVVFDRMANKVITFLAANNQFVPAPDYEDMFPSGLENWVLLRDFNCDGRKDIFTDDVLGMRVFINTTTTPGALTWEPYLFSTGFEGPKSHALLTKNPATNIKVNLQLQDDDLPAIADVDGDGDLDILNIQWAGNTIEFHENLSMDNYQTCDSLEFVRVTRSWGSFRECDCGSFAFNGNPCPPNSGGRTKHAGGKSLLTIDLNGDQQQDILFSEAECTQIFALPNKGTTTEPVFDSFYGFPQSSPVAFVLFPAAFHEDVDFDGKKDLIATPNIFTKEYLNSQLDKSTWFYKNTGTASVPAFNFVKNNFLQGEMIDVGDNAVPAFLDYNGDGLFDLLVSAHGSDVYTSRVYVFENIGTVASPAFKLVDDDYLGFTSARFYNVKIQFADIDNNGTLDLVFTATNFDNSATRLYYLANKSQSRLDFSGGTLTAIDFALTYTENVYLTDIDGDGLPDILAGRSEGNLEYWKNTGSPGAPAFTLETKSFLGLSSTPLRQNLAVAVDDFDGDGASDLLISDHGGMPAIISDFRNKTDATSDLESELVFNSALQRYTQKNLGGKVWPTVANLFNADKPAIVLGNTLGGLHILRHDEGAFLPELPEVDIFPNPVYKQEVLTIRSDRPGLVEVFSSVGQRVSTPVIIRGNQAHQYSVSSLAAGLYVLKFTSNNKSTIRRFVVR